MTDDLIKQLQRGAAEGVDGWWWIMEEAADALEAKDAKIERLEKSNRIYAATITDLREEIKDLERSRRDMRTQVDD